MTPVSASDALVVEGRGSDLLGEMAFNEGQEICLSWSHSVTGGLVRDCFENRNDRLVLTRSYLHDFAAGLGEVEGRGSLRIAAEGGYWIDGIDEAIDNNAVILRVGAPRVGHILESGEQLLHLSAIAAGERVTLRLRPEQN